MKLFKILGLSILIILLSRGILYRSLINYQDIGNRKQIELIDQELIDKINKELTKKETLTIEEILEVTRKLTNRNLKFTFKTTSNNPNQVYKTKRANCIGYSALYTSIGNYILEKQNLAGEYEIIHKIGKLRFLGQDIHQYFSNPFFKDHDFVEIKENQTGNSRYIDPSLNDYLKIKYINSVN